MPPSETSATYTHSTTTGRLETVAGGSSPGFTYAYLPNTNLIQTVTGPVYDNDGNSNVSEYLDVAVAVAAHPEYDPFGNSVMNAAVAGQFRQRFSTKPVDAITGLCYYGCRFYDPALGRWNYRDPMEDEGGINLHGMTWNDPVNWIDVLGAHPLKAGAGNDVPHEHRPAGMFPAEAEKEIDAIVAGIIFASNVNGDEGRGRFHESP